MSKASDRKDVRWRALEAALSSYGPTLYHTLQEATVPEHVGELWISVFVRVYEDVSAFFKADDRNQWFVDQVVTAAEEHGFTICSDAMARLQNTANNGGVGAPDESSEPEVQDSARLAKVAVQIPEEVWNGLRKRLLAREAKSDAEQRRQGASWSQYAVIGTAVVALTGVIYGIADLPASSAAVGATSGRSNAASRLPQPLQSLPTATDAQFQIMGNHVPSLRHCYVTSDTLYLPELSATGDVYTLTVFAAPLAGTGQAWSQVAQAGGKLALTAPPALSQGSGTPQLADWKFIVSGHYATVLVAWSLGQNQLVSAVQVDQLDLQTGQSKLIKVLSSSSGVNDTYVTAVGDGKVVIQPGIMEGLGNSAAMVGLPIQQYTLTGLPPSQALSHAVQIPGTFGFMESPTVTPTGIVFQGIDGQPQDPGAVSATWYELSWDGSLASLQGPPLDNQSHWTVTGRTGQLWWVETTPAAPGSGSQVLMGRLEPSGVTSESPADTLGGPVLAFGVSGSHLVWVQKDAKVTQLVVSEVTQ